MPQSTSKPIIRVLCIDIEQGPDLLYGIDNAYKRSAESGLSAGKIYKNIQSYYDDCIV